MRLKIAWLYASFYFFSSILFAQTNESQTIEFKTNFGIESLSLAHFYKFNENDSIQFTSIKFYISGIEFLENDKTIWHVKNSYHLIDISNEKTSKITLNTPSALPYSKIKFQMGIDSTTNVSGALGGDLDPTKGMYWTWQSGYINFKLEGSSNICKTRNNEFEFHLGGYAWPFASIQEVILIASEKQNQIISLDLKKLISEINLFEENQIMSPSKSTVEFTEKISKLFFVQ